jgi:hypothetical protein
MWVVIISTVSTGRVRRKTFASWDKAQHYADWYHQQAPRYRVEVAAVPRPKTPETTLASPQKAA